jgi:hypothetical protein
MTYQRVNLVDAIDTLYEEACVRYVDPLWDGNEIEAEGRVL